MKKLSLILAFVLLLCGFACAQELPAADDSADAQKVFTAEDFAGLWILEYVISGGGSADPDDYGMNVTITLAEDGSAELNYDGDVDPNLSWRFEDGRAWIIGYAEEDVEMVIDEIGRLAIIDRIGEMYFARPVAEAEEAAA